jgi:3-oxoacyl-[acyl-carrier-protein] synthase II
MKRRVVITGIGPVTSAGIGVDQFFASIFETPRSFQVPVQFPNAALKTRFYIPLPQFTLAAYGVESACENLMQTDDRMAVLAAKLALEDAGFNLPAGDRSSPDGLERASVLVGTGLGGIQTALESFLAYSVPREMLQTALPDRKFLFNRMVVPKTMANSNAAWISLTFGLTGPANTVVASCASGTYAIGEAFRKIADGYHDLALAGGVEWLHEPGGFILRGFDILGVLTTASDGRPGPFGKDRSGFLFAEGGACLLVLEELEHARARQARIYAEVVDYQANSDAFNIVQMDPSGRRVTELLRALATGRKVDYLNAHGTGTVPNDQVEAAAIQAVFGDASAQPLINSTKGLLGHTLGASGAIETAVTALSVARGAVHRNAVSAPMDNLSLPLVTVRAPVQTAITVSYGFGGHNAGLVLTKWEHP